MYEIYWIEDDKVRYRYAATSEKKDKLLEELENKKIKATWRLY
jgi:hypothetical protein